jgi:hypothetical protein
MAYAYPSLPVARAFALCGRVFQGGVVALASLAALAQESPGQARLREAQEALARHRSVFAKMHIQIDLYDQQTIGNGEYRQGPPETRWMAFDVRLKTNNQLSIVQQRCDGNSFWRCDSVDDVRLRVSRIDMARLGSARDEGRAGGVPQLGLGGLPKLLHSLDTAFEFNKVRNEKRGRQRVYALRGQWRPDWLMKWLPDQKAAIAAGKPVDLAKLPPPLPDHVVVRLGVDDLFPYRIEYGRDDPKAPDQSRTLAAIDFEGVAFDGPVERSAFEFEPGKTPVIDETDAYLLLTGSSPKPGR